MASRATTRGGASNSKSRSKNVEFARRPVDDAEAGTDSGKKLELTEVEQGLLGDLFAVIEEHDDPKRARIDRDAVERAFVFACERHADQRRKSGEDFIVHPLGIHAIKWELEDLAFATLHPRKYKEIRGLVNQQREERESYVARAGRYLQKELEAVGIEAAISGRAKHFYSIYSKMTKKGREFNEIYDLTAMRVKVGSVKDCYGAIGVIHSLWKPLPGRFKDFIATPKLNLYQALHTTVIGPEGRPLEIQIRTHEMHETAEYGIAAHWMYKEGAAAATDGDGDGHARSPKGKDH